MEEQDLVYVLIATYNPQKEFFQKQIESILNQTHKNIHIYISDDCSKNESISPFYNRSCYFSNNHINYRNLQFYVRQHMHIKLSEAISFTAAFFQKEQIRYT